VQTAGDLQFAEVGAAQFVDSIVIQHFGLVPGKSPTVPPSMSETGPHALPKHLLFELGED
jgi:hypothetical protein